MASVALLAFQSVFPLLLLMLTGIFLRTKGMLCDQTIRQLNRISSKVFIPCLLFNNVYSAQLQEAFDGKLFLFEWSCIFVIALSLHLLVPMLVKDSKQQFSYICCLYWPNCTMFGLPVLTSLCGEQGTLTGTIMIAAIAPLFSAGTVVFLERFRNGGRVRPGKLMGNILGNPMLWGSILGISCNLLGLSVPNTLLSPIRSIAGMATPMALICLGAFCRWQSVRTLLRTVLPACLCKLVLIPLAVLLTAYALDFRGLQLLGLLIIFASPSAVSTFSIAEPEFADCQLSAALVSLLSLLSVVSYFIWIVLFHAFGLYH